MKSVVAAAAVAALAGVAFAQPVTIGFTGAANGTAVSGAVLPFDGGTTLFDSIEVADLAAGTSVTAGTAAAGDALTGVLFDTDPAGPNAGGEDTDLLIDLSGAGVLDPDPFLLTAQEGSDGTIPGGGIFGTPDDEVGFSIFFDIAPDFVTFEEILVADVNGGSATQIILTDTEGDTRVFNLPAQFTGDVDNGFTGFAIIDLTQASGDILPPLNSPNPGVNGSVVSDTNFDASRAVSLQLLTDGSLGVSNLTVFIPTPGAVALAGLAGLAAARRRRA